MILSWIISHMLFSPGNLIENHQRVWALTRSHIVQRAFLHNFLKINCLTINHWLFKAVYQIDNENHQALTTLLSTRRLQQKIPLREKERRELKIINSRSRLRQLGFLLKVTLWKFLSCDTCSPTINFTFNFERETLKEQKWINDRDPRSPARSMHSSEINMKGLSAQWN